MSDYNMKMKSMMDMALIPTVESLEPGLSSSEKGNSNASAKPRKKPLTSVFLKFFETAPDGRSRKCIFCNQTYSIVTATGNLGRHLNHHHPGYDREIYNNQQTPQTVAQTKKPKHQSKSEALDFENLNWLLLKWFIGSSLCPPNFENEDLLTSFKFLNPSTSLWPEEKVNAITLEIFRSMREDVKAMLEQISSKISVTLDFWTSYEQIFYMAVKCHWIDENWSLHKVLLDVVQVPYPCTGPEIYQALLKVLQMYNVDNKVISCTNDGSSHAVHACHALKEELDARKVSFWYIPCAARILNMIIDDGLRTLKPLLSKIREFAFELNTNPEIMIEFKELAAIYQEGLWEFPLDTSASWNGDYSMLGIARKAPNSMDSTIKKHEEMLNTQNLLTNTEKSVIDLLHSYLEPFHKITTDLCTCEIPTVGLILFFMDHIFEMINTCSENSCHEWLKLVADDMSKSTQSFNTQIYTLFTFMASILDPRIKKELIPDALNFNSNFEEARNHFTRNYATNQITNIAEETNAVSFAEIIARKRRRGNMNGGSDELSQYLLEPPLAMATNILDWWKANSSRYPQLSVMARDFLAVQGTSVEFDELFSSKCGDTLKQKFCLPNGNGQVLMCINSWINSGFKLKYRSAEIDFEKLVVSEHQLLRVDFNV